MAEVVLDAWSVVAYADRPTSASEAADLRRRIERELVAAAEWLSATLDPHLSVRVEQ
jgi:hypothetical protein